MAKSGFTAHPFLLGFEQLEHMVNSAAKNDGYPPFNVEQVDANNYRITLAVAGFDDNSLDITVEDGHLLIAGRQPPGQEEKTYLHRGIAERQFQRRFVLASGVEVSGALLDNGLLHIELTHTPPQDQHRVIKINQPRKSE